MIDNSQEHAKMVIEKIFESCKKESPEPGKEHDLFVSLDMYQGDGNIDVPDLLYGLYKVPKIQAHQPISVVDEPHCSENWQRHRLLINRIVGSMKRLKQYDNDSDHISLAMDENKKLWRDIYNGHGYEMSRQTFWWLFVAIHDTIQRRGGVGVWGGNLTQKKFQDCIQYRELLHCNAKYAFNDELYSALFGWW